MQLLRRTFTPRQVLLVAYAALVVCTVIVFSGAAVRLTGSGLGCPDWPRCDGARLTPELSTHSLIEFGNRMMTFIVIIPCLLAVWMTRRRTPYRRDLFLLAVALPFGVLAQAVWGGLTVIFDLAPVWVIMHFLLSMALLIANVALVWRAKYEAGERPPARDRFTTWAMRALLVPGFAVLTGGTLVTAAGPHAGGAGTGDFVDRIDWHGPDTLNWAVERHSTTATVLGLAAIAVWVLVRLRDRDPVAVRAMTAVCLLMACQGAVGVLQWQLQLPPEVVWVHVVLASLTWVALLTACASGGWIRAREPEAPPPVDEPALLATSR